MARRPPPRAAREPDAHGHRGPLPDPPSWLRRAETVRAAGTGAMVASRTGTWFTAAFAERHPGTAEALLDALRATSAAGYAACCAALAPFDLRGELAGELARVPVPTLVVAGEDDPATPVDTVRLVADRIPGAAFLTLPGAHLINVEAADRVSAALAVHLARS